MYGSLLFQSLTGYLFRKYVVETAEMKQLSLKCCLEIEPPAVVSFYGAGGKTTLLLKLADELVNAGHRVLITTTTNMFIPSGIPLFLGENDPSVQTALRTHFKNNKIASLGKAIIADNKLKGINPSAVGALRRKLEVTVLVEADGARGMPIKGYAPSEPVIPEASDLIVPVTGADALGALLNGSTVHRADLFRKQLGAVPGEIISDTLVTKSFQKMIERGKLQAPGAGVAAILNKADLLDTPGKTALSISRLLTDPGNIRRFILTEAGCANPVKISIPAARTGEMIDVACIVLAAGLSSRMGSNKLSLEFRGKTILEHTLDNIIASGIKDIYVVTAPDSRFSDLISSKKCKRVINPLFESGQASSIKAGLSELDCRFQGVIFALADQPLVGPEIFRAIAANYRSKLKMVTAPVFKGRRGNPTLFDRRSWPDLEMISGDMGGRAIIESLAENDLDLFETNDSAVIHDIDTPEDFRRLSKYLALYQMY
jgi:molybdenum cofactor cytidylyltransferase